MSASRQAETWSFNVGASWGGAKLVGGQLSSRVTPHWQPSPNYAFHPGASRTYRNPVLIETNADQPMRLLLANFSVRVLILPVV